MATGIVAVGLSVCLFTRGTWEATGGEGNSMHVTMKVSIDNKCTLHAVESSMYPDRKTFAM